MTGEPLLDRLRTASARGEDTGPLFQQLADDKLNRSLSGVNKGRYKITGKWTGLDGKNHIRKRPTEENFNELSARIREAEAAGNTQEVSKLKQKWAEWKHADENLSIYIPMYDTVNDMKNMTPGSPEYQEAQQRLSAFISKHEANKAHYTSSIEGGANSPWGYDQTIPAERMVESAETAVGRPVASEDMQTQAQAIIGDLDEAGQRRVKMAYEGRLNTDKRSLDKIMKDMTPKEKDALKQLEDLVEGPIDPATQASNANAEAAKLHQRVMNERFGRLSKAQVREKTQQLDDLTDQYDAAVKAGDIEMAESLQREMRIIKQDLNPAGVTEADPEAVAARADATEAKASKSPADTTGVRRGVAASLYRTVDEANRMQGASTDELDRVLNAGDGGQVRNVSPSDSDVSPTGAGDLGRAQEGYGSSMAEKMDALSRSDWDIEDSAIPEKFRNSMDLMGGLDTKTKKRYAHLLSEGGDDLQKENIEDIYRAIDDPSKISDLTPEEVDALSYAVQNLDEFSSSSVQGIVPKLTDAQKAGATSARRMDDMYAQISGRKRVGVDPDDRTVPSVTMLTGERVSAEDVYDNFLNDLVEKNKLDTFVKDQELGMNMIVDHMDSAAPMPGSDFILSRINRAETTGQYANERFFGYGDLSQHDEAIGEFQAYGFGTLSQNPAGLEDLVAHITNPRKGMYARLQQAKGAGHADNVSKYELMINEAETQLHTIVRGLTDAQRNSKKAQDALEVFENSKASSWYETPRSGHGIVGGVHTKATPRPKKPAGPKPPPREEPQESDMPYDEWEFNY